MDQLVRVYVASSLDGFIAGVEDDLSWLPSPNEAEGADYGWGDFFANIGALLMGRRTYDVVTGFDAWHYEDRPVLVATARPLEKARPTVRAVGGTIDEMVGLAKRAAAGRDVYLDGGNLIRQALDAELVDEITVTVVPVVLGEGVALFAGTSHRHELELTANRDLGAGLVQLTYRCKGR